MNGISVLIGDPTEIPVHRVRTPRDAGYEPGRGSSLCWHLHLGLASLQYCRNTSVVYKYIAYSILYSVIAAQQTETETSTDSADVVLTNI